MLFPSFEPVDSALLLLDESFTYAYRPDIVPVIEGRFNCLLLMGGEILRLLGPLEAPPIPKV